MAIRFGKTSAGLRKMALWCFTLTMVSSIPLNADQESVARYDIEFPSASEMLQRFYNWITGTDSFNLEDATVQLANLSASFPTNSLASRYALDVTSAFVQAIDAIDQSSALSNSDKTAAKIAASGAAREKIAILRFVIENISHSQVASALQSANRGSALAQLCGSYFEQTKYQIKTQGSIYEELGIQDASGYIKATTPLEIAAMLLGADEQINIDLIPMIQKYFLSAPQLAPWQLRLQQGLSAIDSSWQTTLDSITLPVTGSLAMRTLQATYNVASDSALSTLDAKVAVLGAAFTEYTPEQPLSYKVRYQLWKEERNPLTALQAYARAIQNSEASYSLPLPDATGAVPAQNWVLALSLANQAQGCGCNSQ